MKKFSRRSFIEFSSLGAAAIGASSLLPPAGLSEKVAAYLSESGKEVSGKDFLQWGFGGVSYASPVKAQSMDFKFRFKPTLERKEYSFRNEVFRACERIDRERRGARVALCFSGGADSEVVASVMSQMGIPFDLYFLSFWGLNADLYEHWAKPVGRRKFQKEVHLVEVGKPEFLDYAKAAFSEFGCEAPTYLGLTYLFSRIPEDQYIVTGDGDLDRRGELFAHIGQQNLFAAASAGINIPFSTSSVVLDLWSKARDRRGEFYFFRSTPGLIAASITDPAYSLRFPFSDAKGVLHNAFPEVARRQKSTNWEGIASRENYLVRRSLEQHARNLENFAFWRRLAGTIVRADEIFIG